MRNSYIKFSKSQIIINLVLLFIPIVSLSCKNDSINRKVNFTRSKSFYKFENVGDTTYSIVWGNKSFRNKSKSNFEILGNGKLSLLDSNQDAIILKQGCGLSCTYSVVLPLKPGSTEKVYLFSIAHEPTKNLIAYIPEEDCTFVKVENYINDKSFGIKETRYCNAAFRGDCINHAYFDGNTFYLNWQGINEDGSENQKIKKFEIEL